MRLLDRSRPDVHVALLVEAAVERKRLLLGPGAQDEVMGFVVTVSQLAWIGAIRVRGVHWRADRKPGDESTAGDAVDHGELFGDPCWRVVEGKAVAQDADHRIGGAPSEGGSHKVRRRHESIAVRVMFVAADGVVAALGGELELI